MSGLSAVGVRLILVGVLIPGVGCSKSPNSDSVSETPTEPPTATSPVIEPDRDSEATAVAVQGLSPQELAVEAVVEEPAWRKGVTLELQKWAETQRLIEQQRGRVVVVDIWSTACEPCLREFPHLVELQNQLPQDVVCIGVNCDFAGVRRKPPEFYRERVTKVLDARMAHILNVMCTQPADELFQELKIDSIPAVFVYDRTGKLAAVFDNRTNESADFTYDADVLPVVHRLVAGETETTDTAAR